MVPKESEPLPPEDPEPDPVSARFTMMEGLRFLLKQKRQYPLLNPETPP